MVSIGSHVERPAICSPLLGLTTAGEGRHEIASLRTSGGSEALLAPTGPALVRRHVPGRAAGDGNRVVGPLLRAPGESQGLLRPCTSRDRGPARPGGR